MRLLRRHVNSLSTALKTRLTSSRSFCSQNERVALFATQDQISLAQNIQKASDGKQLLILLAENANEMDPVGLAIALERLAQLRTEQRVNFRLLDHFPEVISGIFRRIRHSMEKNEVPPEKMPQLTSSLLFSLSHLERQFSSIGRVEVSNQLRKLYNTACVRATGIILAAREGEGVTVPFDPRHRLSFARQAQILHCLNTGKIGGKRPARLASAICNQLARQHPALLERALSPVATTSALTAVARLIENADEVIMHTTSGGVGGDMASNKDNIPSCTSDRLPDRILASCCAPLLTARSFDEPFAVSDIDPVALGSAAKHLVRHATRRVVHDLRGDVAEAAGVERLTARDTSQMVIACSVLRNVYWDRPSAYGRQWQAQYDNAIAQAERDGVALDENMFALLKAKKGAAPPEDELATLQGLLLSALLRSDASLEGSDAVTSSVLAAQSVLSIPPHELSVLLPHAADCLLRSEYVVSLNEVDNNTNTYMNGDKDSEEFEEYEQDEVVGIESTFTFTPRTVPDATRNKPNFLPPPPAVSSPVRACALIDLGWALVSGASQSRKLSMRARRREFQSLFRLKQDRKTRAFLERAADPDAPEALRASVASLAFETYTPGKHADRLDDPLTSQVRFDRMLGNSGITPGRAAERILYHLLKKEEVVAALVAQGAVAALATKAAKEHPEVPRTDLLGGENILDSMSRLVSILMNFFLPDPFNPASPSTSLSTLSDADLYALVWACRSIFFFRDESGLPMVEQPTGMQRAITHECRARLEDATRGSGFMGSNVVWLEDLRQWMEDMEQLDPGMDALFKNRIQRLNELDETAKTLELGANQTE